MLLLSACGSTGSATSKAKPAPSSVGTYDSASAIAAKLTAAHLGCASFQKAPFDVQIDGMPKAKDQKQCLVGDAADGTVNTAIAVYADRQTLQRALTAGTRAACDFGAKHLPYQVTGTNWDIGTAYNEILARKVAAATGGVESQPRPNC